MSKKVLTAQDKCDILLKLKATFDEQFDKQLAAVELKDDVTEYGCSDEDTPIEETLGVMFDRAYREVYDKDKCGSEYRIQEQFLETLKWAYVQRIGKCPVDMWVHGSWDQAYFMYAIIVKLTQLGLCKTHGMEKKRYLIPIYKAEDLTKEENDWLDKAIFYDFMHAQERVDLCIGHRYADDKEGSVLEYWNFKKSDKGYIGIYHNFKHTERPKVNTGEYYYDFDTGESREIVDHEWDGEKLLYEINADTVEEFMEAANAYIKANNIPTDTNKPEDVLHRSYDSITIYPFQIQGMPERFKKDLRGSVKSVHQIYRARKLAIQLATLSDLDDKYCEQGQVSGGYDWLKMEKLYQEDHDRIWNELFKLIHDNYRNWWD